MEKFSKGDTVEIIYPKSRLKGFYVKNTSFGVMNNIYSPYSIRQVLSSGIKHYPNFKNIYHSRTVLIEKHIFDGI